MNLLRRACRAAPALGLVLATAVASPAGAASPPQTAPALPAVTHFWLVDADTDARILEVGENQILGLPLLPANLSIEAEANGATGSMALTLNGGPPQVESNVPYALGGDTSGNFAPVPGLRTPGQLTITAQPFAGEGGIGTSGPTRTIHLTALQPNYLVDDPKDVHDLSPGNGTCETAPVVLPPPNLSGVPAPSGGTPGQVSAQPEFHGCTLRAAIEEANATPGAQTILIDGAKGPFVLSLGELLVTTPLTVAGHASPLIDANHGSRAFRVAPANQDIQVSLAGLILTRGAPPGVGDWGGNVLVENRAKVRIDRSVIREGRANYGGGVAVTVGAQLLLTRSAVVGNFGGHPENFNGGGTTQRAGGVYNQGTTDIIDSTIADNRAVRGGGLGNAGGTLRITSSSVVDNHAESFGGGIDNEPNGGTAGELQLTFSTVHNNVSGQSAFDPGYLRVAGGIYNNSRMSMASSVVAGNHDPFTPDNTLHSPDCWSPAPLTIKSYRNNTIGALTHTCTIADHLLGNGSFIDAGTGAAPIDPKLGTRAGDGLRAYYVPQVGSPLIDRAAGPVATVYPCPDHDQRNQARPVGKGCDQGAVERP